ncbi:MULTISPECIES: hypothetical protein [unclassified Streptomyces]|uniref:hypothetical protein n=1 Tax=unclassified Streptomyces TaxID=2593676 RepID=UPI000DC7B979|nr:MULTISPECIES: hypothetical protein [unclassified Streptomyces]AWZ04454.1 hypothetical protein DRB89_07170 [Streptomyces sp. ICC4]
MRTIRTAARIVGRRTALRYLAIGAGAAFLAACTGKDKPSARASAAPPSTDTPSTAGSGSAPPTSSAPAKTPGGQGVIERSVEAFLTGTWSIRTTTPGGQTLRGRATVQGQQEANGKWTIEWEGGAGTWKGGFVFRRGLLMTQVNEGPKRGAKGAASAHDVPGKVGDGFDLTLPWQPPEKDGTGDGERLTVGYAKNTLTIRHFNASGSTTIHTATRA